MTIPFCVRQDTYRSLDFRLPRALPGGDGEANTIGNKEVAEEEKSPEAGLGGESNSQSRSTAWVDLEATARAMCSEAKPRSSLDILKAPNQMFVCLLLACLFV